MEETIKGLTKTIAKLRKENEELYKYLEAFQDMSRKCDELERRLDIKRSVCRITGYYDNDLMTGYLLQIIDEIDTPEGMFIKLRLPLTPLPTPTSKK